MEFLNHGLGVYGNQKSIAYDPITAGKIVNACCILHNYCLNHNDDVELEEGIILKYCNIFSISIIFTFSAANGENELGYNEYNINNDERNLLLMGRQILNRILNDYF